MQSAVLRHRCHHLGISQVKLKYFTKKSAALWLFSCLHSSLPFSSFHSQLTRLTTLSWLIAPLRRDSRQCIQPRTVSPSWDCPGNSWQFSIKAVCPETGDFKTYGFPKISDRNRPAEQAASRAWPRACTWLPADTGRTRPAANRGCNSTGAAKYSKTY